MQVCILLSWSFADFGMEQLGVFACLLAVMSGSDSQLNVASLPKHIFVARLVYFITLDVVFTFIEGISGADKG